MQQAHMINVEQEMQDALKQTMFQIKFVAFKTPSSLGAAMPVKLFFTFKFFTFNAVQTDPVHIHTNASDEQLKYAT